MGPTAEPRHAAAEGRSAHVRSWANLAKRARVRSGKRMPAEREGLFTEWLNQCSRSEGLTSNFPRNPVCGRWYEGCLGENMSKTLASAFALVSVLTIASRAFADEPVPTDQVAEAAPSLPALPPAATAPAPRQAAPAEGPAEPAASPRTGPSEWYGYETLLVDGAGLGLGAASVAGGIPFGIAGLATYVLGGPIVHAVHGHGGKVGIDLAVRLGAPAVGLATGAAIGCAMVSCGKGDFSAIIGIIGGGVGAGVGMLTAIIIDAAVLANEPAAPAKAKPWNGKPTFTPQVSALPGGGSVGVGGAF